MTKNNSKDGIVTNTLELIPFGGILTALFHAVAGNKVQTVKALVIGIVSGAAFLAGMGVISTAIGFLASSITQKLFMNTKNPTLSKQIIPESKIESDLEKRVEQSFEKIIENSLEKYFKNTLEQSLEKCFQKTTEKNLESAKKITQMVYPEKPMCQTMTQCQNRKAVVLVNRWGFSLSVGDWGNISHKNTNRNRDGWEGWVIQQFKDSHAYISRNSGKGKLVIAIGDEGNIYSTNNRCSSQVFQVKHWQEYGVMTFQRVKEPRWYLACTNEGKICATKSCNLQGWEAWIPK